MVPGHGELNTREHHSRDFSAAHRRNFLLNGVCCLLAAASVGCTRDASTANEAALALRTRVVTADLPPNVSARAAAAVEAAVQRKSARAFEDDILRLEADHPGVGGAYWSEDGTMFVVHLTDVSTESHLRGVIARQLANWRVAPEMRRIALANLRVLPGRYAFSTLVAWQQMLLEDSEARPLWNTLDADEVANRVRASVSSTEVVEQLEAVAERLGIPREGLLLRYRSKAVSYGQRAGQVPSGIRRTPSGESGGRADDLGDLHAWMERDEREYG